MSLVWNLLYSSIFSLIALHVSKEKKADELRAFPKRPPSLNLPIPEQADFIIVGGGTAGCILANRLSQNFSVLLIEAGGVPPPMQNVAILNTITRDSPDINFLYESQSENNAGRENGGKVAVTAGKMLGGSSSHNDLIWERGHPYDYDVWAQLTRDNSWKYENVLKYFIKIENYTGTFSTEKGNRGTQGPFHITEDSFAPGVNVWLQAGKESGYEVRDPNGPQGMGFSPLAFAKTKGRRVSTFTAYLKALMKKGARENLRVHQYSFVSEVVFEDKRAVGVIYTRHGVLAYAEAKREVILSAGTFISPIILFKSGIGPGEEIKAANADPVSILPVGRNLMDHASVEIQPFHINNPEYAWNFENNLTYADIEEFKKNGTGPFTGSAQSAEAYTISLRALLGIGVPIQFLNNQEIQWNKWPDIQVQYSYFIGSKPKEIGCIVFNGRPLSRGMLTHNASATSMADNHLPVLRYNYFWDETDFDVTIEGINFCLRILETTPSFRAIGTMYSLHPYLPCLLYIYRSREYWKCYIRHKARTGHHSVGTCRMGYGQGDSKAVVDSKFRVIGVKGLRVVDASIMPVITNANTLAPTMLIAEKASDDILKQYLGSKNKS